VIFVKLEIVELEKSTVGGKINVVTNTRFMLFYEV